MTVSSHDLKGDNDTVYSAWAYKQRALLRRHDGEGEPITPNFKPLETIHPGGMDKVERLRVGEPDTQDKERTMLPILRTLQSLIFKGETDARPMKPKEKLKVAGQDHLFYIPNDPLYTAQRWRYERRAMWPWLKKIYGLSAEAAHMMI